MKRAGDLRVQRLSPLIAALSSPSESVTRGLLKGTERVTSDFCFAALQISN